MHLAQGQFQLEEQPLTYKFLRRTEEKLEDQQFSERKGRI
jgi:hypothetical protein